MAQFFFNGEEIKPERGKIEISGHPEPDVGGAVLRIKEADVKSAGNYSCIPFNRVGVSIRQPNPDDSERFSPAARAFVNIEVHTEPRFIQTLDKQVGKKTTKITTFL